MKVKATIMDAMAIERALTRIAHEVVEKNKGIENLYLVGIQRRGVPLAHRIAKQIEDIEGVRPEVGILDITFYRDDLSLLSESPQVNATQIYTNLNNKTVLLVDDVIYTGRTVRAAIDALFDMGRPACVQLATLIDRGHRELPFRPDFIGKNVPTSRSEQIEVWVTDIDGEDKVILGEKVIK
ncbi:MAG TPA: bifunctional pyr operon transcriptional regulator/uracil phosphoribosyltransferase PyrR [Clostridiaceae bacterium]|nr:bifunctional pyr operon transcriptional regulator/uracil phosphoribosyltransferase PyrR [Clostridiaceae bacterium]